MIAGFFKMVWTTLLAVLAGLSFRYDLAVEQCAGLFPIWGARTGIFAASQDVMIEILIAGCFRAVIPFYWLSRSRQPFRC